MGRERRVAENTKEARLQLMYGNLETGTDALEPTNFDQIATIEAVLDHIATVEAVLEIRDQKAFDE